MDLRKVNFLKGEDRALHFEELEKELVSSSGHNRIDGAGVLDVFL